MYLSMYLLGADFLWDFFWGWMFFCFSVCVSFPCYLLHFGTKISDLHAICCMLDLKSAILHAICSISDLKSACLHVICSISELKPQI